MGVMLIVADFGVSPLLKSIYYIRIENINRRGNSRISKNVLMVMIMIVIKDRKIHACMYDISLYLVCI